MVRVSGAMWVLGENVAEAVWAGTWAWDRVEVGLDHVGAQPVRIGCGFATALMPMYLINPTS